MAQDDPKYARSDWKDFKEAVLATPITESLDPNVLKQIANLLKDRSWLVKEVVDELIKTATIDNTSALKDSASATKLLTIPTNTARLLEYIVARSQWAANRIGNDSDVLRSMVDFVATLHKIITGYGLSRITRDPPFTACINAYISLFKILCNKVKQKKVVELATGHLKRMGIWKEQHQQQPSSSDLESIEHQINNLNTDVDDLLLQMSQCFEILFSHGNNKSEAKSNTVEMHGFLETPDILLDDDEFDDVEFDQAVEANQNPGRTGSRPSSPRKNQRSQVEHVDIELHHSRPRLPEYEDVNSEDSKGIVPGLDDDDMKPVKEQLQDYLKLLKSYEGKVNNLAEQLASKPQDENVNNLLGVLDDIAMKIYNMDIKCRQVGVVVNQSNQVIAENKSNQVKPETNSHEKSEVQENKKQEAIASPKSDRALKKRAASHDETTPKSKKPKTSPGKSDLIKLLKYKR